ncbi:MAG: hypothetical protein ACI8PZ_002445 [Myxococcota bacterium]|jgi:hypothetical protein
MAATVFATLAVVGDAPFPGLGTVVSQPPVLCLAPRWISSRLRQVAGPSQPSARASPWAACHAKRALAVASEGRLAFGSPTVVCTSSH